MNVEVFFSPREYSGLPREDLAGTICVVFDVLRATSSMVTALAHGATSVAPVATIDQALAIREAQPEVLLAGERHGLRILAAQTGSIDFDFGNSPREFVSSRVAKKALVMTTTNGTQALQAVAKASSVYIGAFLNLKGVTQRLLDQRGYSRLLLICSGTLAEAAYEDALAAGALLDQIWDRYQPAEIADSAQIARQIFLQGKADLEVALQLSKNARRLWANPELRDDVAFCLQQDLFSFCAELKPDGTVRICS